MRMNTLVVAAASLLATLPPALAEIPAGPDAPLGAAFRAELLEDVLSRTVEVYKQITPADDPNREKAIGFLTGAAHWLAGTTDRPDYLHALLPGHELTRDGYKDPLVNWACGYLFDLQLHWDRAENNWQFALAPMADAQSPYSLRTRMHALSVISAWVHYHRGDSGSHQIWAAVAEMLTDYVSDEQGEGLSGRMLHAALAPMLTSMATMEALQDMAAAINKHIDDDWARETLLGASQFAMAWRMRGHGAADTVTDEGWRGFRTHMLAARRHLLRAYATAPDRPEAASYLIDVSRAEMAPPGTTARDWFDRAVAAEFDYLPAYESYARTISVRWGGSEQMLDSFANECIQTNRFDTRVPLMALQAYNWMERDLTPEATWSNEQRYQTAMRLLNRFLDNAPENQRLAPRTAMYVIASRAGDWEVVDRLEEEIGLHADGYTLWQFEADREVIRKKLAEHRRTRSQ